MNGGGIRIPDGARVECDPTAHVASNLRLVGRGKLVIGAHAVIDENVLLDFGGSGAGSIVLASRSKLKWGVCIRCYNGSVTVGHRTSVGEYTVIAGHGGVTIGDHCGIGPHCTLTASEHIPDSSIPIRYQGERAAGIRVTDDVWIGAGAHVLDGVSLGEHCVIGAGAVVTRSMPADHVCVGVPCRPIRNLADPDRNSWREERR